ncbi:hypothetical protein BDV93DRAFT_560638 [Ceratobasidium sp. AG-I]|nr:hypothetical protein BDV93DRAFT_560638 [Ceratobasidium sp. AG-I]
MAAPHSTPEATGTLTQEADRTGPPENSNEDDFVMIPHQSPSTPVPHSNVEPTDSILPSVSQNSGEAMVFELPLGEHQDSPQHIRSPIVSEAVNDPAVVSAIVGLGESYFDLWLGHPHRILENCAWQSVDRSTSILSWKADAPRRPPGVNAHSNAIVSFVGQLVTYRSSIGPTAGWQLWWGESKLHKLKRTCHIIRPVTTSNRPLPWWRSQWEGSKIIVENGRELPNGGHGDLGHCFVDLDLAGLHIRDPVFMPLPCIGGRNQAYQFEKGRHSLFSVYRKLLLLTLHLYSLVDTFLTHGFSTWAIPSQVTREAFGRAIAQGYKPQVLEAYDESDELIHPNNVQTKLNGAIVIVSCTLERLLILRPWMRRPEYHFYANLVELQVLKG